MQERPRAAGAILRPRRPGRVVLASSHFADRTHGENSTRAPSTVSTCMAASPSWSSVSQGVGDKPDHACASQLKPAARQESVTALVQRAATMSVPSEPRSFTEGAGEGSTAPAQARQPADNRR